MLCSMPKIREQPSARAVVVYEQITSRATDRSCRHTANALLRSMSAIIAMFTRRRGSILRVLMTQPCAHASLLQYM